MTSCDKLMKTVTNYPFCDQVAAVREEAEAEVQRGKKELGDRVSYLNQELQVRSDTSQEHAHVVCNLYLFKWLQMSTHLPCKHNLPSSRQPSNNKPSQELDLAK